MRRVHSGHAPTTEQALLARATTLPVPAARHPHYGTDPNNRRVSAARKGRQHRRPPPLLLPPEDDTRPAATAGFGFYDEYQEADK
ncbi:hypothetical protein GCM10010206_77190 [Streptomyces cinerochromogenes]|nr:hypothetical protein GCM10010206_77190 [Streptomyces cinerochromogenes]